MTPPAPQRLAEIRTLAAKCAAWTDVRVWMDFDLRECGKNCLELLDALAAAHACADELRELLAVQSIREKCAAEAQLATLKDQLRALTGRSVRNMSYVESRARRNRWIDIDEVHALLITPRGDDQ